MTFPVSCSEVMFVHVFMFNQSSTIGGSGCRCSVHLDVLVKQKLEVIVYLRDPISSPKLRMVSWNLNDLCVLEVMKDTPC